MSKFENLKWLEWAEDECAPFLGGEAMNTEVDAFEVEDLAAAFAYLDYTEKEITKRKNAMRERLLAEADKRGSVTERGGSILFTDAAKIIKERRVGKLPAKTLLIEMLKAKGLDPNIVFTVVEETIIDPSKLELAIDTGKLDHDEVNGLRKVSYALKVDASNDLEKLMMEAREPYEIIPQAPIHEELAEKPDAKAHAAMRNKAASALKAKQKAAKAEKAPAKKTAKKKAAKKAPAKKTPKKKAPSARRGA